MSTTRQGEGVSLDEQRAAISTYAEKHRLEITRWFEEKETAAKQGRPVFRDVLNRLRRGEAGGLIIHKIDRGARNLRDWADLNEFMEHGSIHFAHESLDLATRGGRLAADIQAVVAADFIRNLRDETRKGHLGRLKQGIFPFVAPLGYRNTGPGKLKAIDPTTGPLIREAFELYAGGEFSLHALSEELFKRGLRTKGGKRVYKGYLGSILRNPFYAGTIRIRRTGETYEGKHYPLVTPSLFDQVQGTLDGRAQKGPKRHLHLYRRLFTCGDCGRSRRLVGERQKDRVYYRCHGRGCPSKSIREDQVSETVEATLSQLRFSEHEVAYLAQKLDEARRDSKNRAASDLEKLERELGGYESRLKRLTLAYVDGDVEQAVFLSTKEELLARKARAEERRTAMRDNPAATFDLAHKTLELAVDAQQSFKEASDAEKRSLLETVSSNRVFADSELFIELQFPFSEMACSPCVPSMCIDQYTVRTQAELDTIVRALSTQAGLVG